MQKSKKNPFHPKRPFPLALAFLLFAAPFFSCQTLKDLSPPGAIFDARVVYSPVPGVRFNFLNLSGSSLDGVKFFASIKSQGGEDYSGDEFFSEAYEQEFVFDQEIPSGAEEEIFIPFEEVPDDAEEEGMEIESLFARRL